MLKEKVAIITGGSNGIGKATGRKFLENGASVIVWDVDKDNGEKLAEEWSGEGYKAKFYPVDITNIEAVEKTTKQCVEDFGKIDILINNAGITRDASLKKMTTDQWQKVIDVNLTGVFNCTKAVTPIMVENKYGRVINASSIVGLYGNYGQTNYVAAKAGVIGMTKVWAREFGKHNITVNAIAPGFIQTEMVKTVPQHIIDAMLFKSSIKRLGEVEDIANAYLYLASDLASFVTGITLSVDGGLVA